MRENEIWTHLVAEFTHAFGALEIPGLDLTGVIVKQNYQPRTTGADSGPTLYLQLVTSRRVGSPGRSTIPDPDNPLEVIRREVQNYETTFQATGIFTQTPEAVGPTAKDVADFGAACIQSDEMMDRLRAHGLGVLRVTDVRNPKFVNGSDEFEASPSFDFTLTHEQVTLSKTAAVSTTEFRQYPV